MHASTIFTPVDSGTRCVVIQSPPNRAPSSTILGPSLVTITSVCDGPFLIPIALLAATATLPISSAHFNLVGWEPCVVVQKTVLTAPGQIPELDGQLTQLLVNHGIVRDDGGTLRQLIQTAFLLGAVEECMIFRFADLFRVTYRDP